MAYASLADSSGDPWDAVLALLHFSRARAMHPKIATPELLATMKRMRQLAGRRPYAPPIPGARYPVYFSAYDKDDEYEVNTNQGSCVTPCMLEMTSGPHYLSASGDIETELFIPTNISRVRLQADNNTETLGGAVLVPVGVLVAGGMWAVGLPCEEDGCRIANFTAWPLLGAGMLTAGIVLLAIAEDVPLDANRADNVGFAPVITPDLNGRPRATGGMATLSASF